MASDSGFKPQKEINRIKSQVRKLEKEKEKTFPDLGKLAYQAFLEGRLNDPALVEVCSRLKEMDSQVEQANAQMSSLQAQAQQMKETKKSGAPGYYGACPSCGTAVTPGLNFCGNCGAAIAQGPPVLPAPSYPAATAAAPPQPDSPPSAPISDTTTRAPVAPPAPAAPPPPPAAPVPPPVPVPPAGTGAEETVVRCSACGAPVEESKAQFCGECGARIG